MVTLRLGDIAFAPLALAQTFDHSHAAWTRLLKSLVVQGGCRACLITYLGHDWRLDDAKGMP